MNNTNKTTDDDLGDEFSHITFNDGSEAHQKIIDQGEIMTPFGRRNILSDGSYSYDNRTNEEMLADAEIRSKIWRKENPEIAAEIKLHTDNEFKYRDSGVFYQELAKDYLHQQSYEQRLAKAEALNGCKFKPSPPYKSKAWGEPMDRTLHNINDGFANLCDGQTATMGRLNGFMTMFFIFIFFAVLFAFFSLFNGNLWLTPVLLLLAAGMFRLMFKVAHYDQFVFNRHTGLIKTPHNWWRRSFYTPYEDLECYDGGVVKSARGGGARSTAKFRCMKTPKRYYLKTPEFIARFGGVRQGTWAAYLAFMDTSIPINPDLHKSIEHYYRIDKNALETEVFPEVMKQYIDPEDVQINREHVW